MQALEGMRPKPMANPAHQVVSCKRWRKMQGMASQGMPPSPNDWKTYGGPAWWLEAKGLELLHEPLWSAVNISSRIGGVDGVIPNNHLPNCPVKTFIRGGWRGWRLGANVDAPLVFANGAF